MQDIYCEEIKLLWRRTETQGTLVFLDEYLVEQDDNNGYVMN